MLNFQQFAEKLSKVNGSTVTFRVNQTSMQALLVRSSGNESELSLDMVFENANPKKFSYLYSLLRRNVGSVVNVSVSGYTFSGVVHDTTVLPTGFDPAAYLDDVFAIVFSSAKKTATSKEKGKGMIAIPIPNELFPGVKFEDNAHITLGYLPAVTGPEAEALSWVLQQVISTWKPFVITTKGQAVFGKDCLVALVDQSTKLRAFRNYVIENVRKQFPGLVDMDTYPVWRAHITLGQAGPKYDVPNQEIVIDKVGVFMRNGPEYVLEIV